MQSSVGDQNNQRQEIRSIPNNMPHHPAVQYNKLAELLKQSSLGKR